MIVYLFVDMANNTMSSCIFCDIIEKKSDATIHYEDDDIIIFDDIRPAALHHYLIVPKRHIKDCSYLTEADRPLLEKLISHAREILQQRGADLSDARYGFHWPPFRSVPHLHLHAISPASQMGFISRLIFRPDSYWFVSPEYIMDRIAKL